MNAPKFANIKKRPSTPWLTLGWTWLVLGCLSAGTLAVPNGSLEEQSLPDVTNASFDGTHGERGTVPGWASNEPGFGGAIRVDEHYPGRTGNNVLYLHGSPEQNFHTADFDLGVDLQSDTTYVLTFDVLRWKGVTKDDRVIFRVGLYTGTDYENRTPLREFAGEILLVDTVNNPVDKVTVTLVHTTGKVAPGTKFWIGGDAFGMNEDHHRTHFDNFSLQTETK